MFCYSNNGLSMVAVEKDYTAGDGEVVFTDYAGPEQLAESFPGYTAAVAELAKEAIRKEASSKIEDSGKIYIRSMAAGFTWPNEWKEYVVALIQISQTGIGTIPAAPAEPQN